MNRLTACAMSRSVTRSKEFCLLLLQIETSWPAKSGTTTKVPVPIVVVGATGIEKVPAGRVLDGDFAV